MPKQIIIILFFAFVTNTNAQINIPEFNASKDSIQSMVYYKFVKKLLPKSQLFIGYRTYSSWNPYNKECTIISFENDKKWHSYNIRRIHDSIYLVDLKIKQSTVKKVWQTANQNKLFSIPEKDTSYYDCDATIRDGNSYEFWIVNNNKIEKLDYYSPEFFEENCKSNSARLSIINCAKAFKKLTKMFNWDKVEILYRGARFLQPTD